MSTDLSHEAFSNSEFQFLIKGMLRVGGSTQKQLASELGMDQTVLSHKLAGTGRYVLTHSDVKQIIKVLVKLDVVYRYSQISELLKAANCPGFIESEWNSEPLAELKTFSQPVDVPAIVLEYNTPKSATLHLLGRKLRNF